MFLQNVPPYGVKGILLPLVHRTYANTMTTIFVGASKDAKVPSLHSTIWNGDISIIAIMRKRRLNCITKAIFDSFGNTVSVFNDDLKNS